MRNLVVLALNFGVEIVSPSVPNSWEPSSEHTEIPVFAVGVYLWAIFYLPDVLPFPLKLRRTFAVWNLALSLFSTGLPPSRALAGPDHRWLEPTPCLCTVLCVPGAWHSRVYHCRLPNAMRSYMRSWPCMSGVGCGLSSRFFNNNIFYI